MGRLTVCSFEGANCNEVVVIDAPDFFGMHGRRQLVPYLAGSMKACSAFGSFIGHSQ